MSKKIGVSIYLLDSPLFIFNKKRAKNRMLYHSYLWLSKNGALNYLIFKFYLSFQSPGGEVSLINSISYSKTSP